MWLKFAAIGVMLILGNLFAQEYPNKPITILVPFTAGGPADKVARVLAKELGKSLQQKIIVNNISGGGGLLATEEFIKAKPDGYTLMFHHTGLSLQPSINPELRFNLTDFRSIGRVVDNPMMLAARKNFPANTIQELVSYAKKHKDKILIGHAGIGSASHLCSILFTKSISADFKAITYKGTMEAIADLSKGQIDLVCDQTSNLVAPLNRNTIKAYAVTSKDRSPMFPNIPTLKESGFPGFELIIWYGLYAPKDTPDTIVKKLVEVLQYTLSRSETKYYFEALATTVVPEKYVNPNSLRSKLESEINKWQPIIKSYGIHAD